MIMVNIPQIYLWIYDKYSSTSFKQCLPIFPLNALVAWQRGLGANLPSRWFSLLYKFASFRFVSFRFVLFFFVFNHTVFSPRAGFPLKASRHFCDKRVFLVMLNIILAHSYTVHGLPIEIWSKWKVQRSSESTQTKLQNNRPSPEIPHDSCANSRGSPHEIGTLRVAQFDLKISHLAISMGPRRPRACGLVPRFWLLLKPCQNVWVRGPEKWDIHTDSCALEIFPNTKFAANILMDQKDLSEQHKTTFFVGQVKCLIIIIIIIILLITVIRVKKTISYCR